MNFHWLEQRVHTKILEFYHTRKLIYMKNAKMAVNKNTSMYNLIRKKFQNVNSKKKVRTSLFYFENSYVAIYTEMESWLTWLTRVNKTTIVFIIFLDILIDEQIFFSQQVKRSMIISNKHGVYELPHELPKDLRLRILEN